MGGRRYRSDAEVSTSDVEFVPAIAGSVEGGSTKGHDEFRRFFDALGETWETFRLRWTNSMSWATE